MKSSVIKLPQVHGILTTETKGASQIKPRLGQGSAGLRHKIKTPVPLPLINIL